MKTAEAKQNYTDGPHVALSDERGPNAGMIRFDSIDAAYAYAAAFNAVEELADAEVLIETNEGTFGAEECCRVTGTGDSKFGNYSVYEQVGGGRRVEGCDPANAPGYPRKMNTDELKDQQKILKALRAELKEAAKQALPAGAPAYRYR